ncbi:hypothetical protein R1sor_026390 [Riccia sorocarpa]|uniref:Retrovirus-related Pol polyprotein from transposon TNT 1-94-like beta-barrel domain-containing protein n=1 Tax=Riccia sorocarpa TaxID=122646 RepID=A0ABD3GB99_9MARC
MAEFVILIIGEKLDKTNYSVWKFRMKTFLLGQGLWELVTGEEEEPIVVPTDPTNVLARKEWMKRSFQAVHYIALTVGASYIGHIQDCDSPKKAWDALSNLFQSGTKARKLQLLQQFNSVKNGAMCINNFVNQIKSLADQLASVKAAVDPTVLIRTTLQGLPNETKQFVTSIATREPLPTFEQLVSMMLGEEVRMRAASSNQQSEKIYYAGYGGSRGRGRGRGYQGGSQRQPQQANEEEQLLITTHQSLAMFEPVQDWVIDSGATSHMTAHQDWFSNLELLQAPQYMVTGDDTKHEIQHKGNVPMQLTDSKLAGLRSVLHATSSRSGRLFSTSNVTSSPMHSAMYGQSGLVV